MERSKASASKIPIPKASILTVAQSSTPSRIPRFGEVPAASTGSPHTRGNVPRKETVVVGSGSKATPPASPRTRVPAPSTYRNDTPVRQREVPEKPREKFRQTEHPQNHNGATPSSPRMRIPSRPTYVSIHKKIPEKAREIFSQTENPKMVKNEGICQQEKMMEPHRLNSHDSVGLVPAKGSEGDQVNICAQKNENKETGYPPETKVLAGLAAVAEKPREIFSQTENPKMVKNEGICQQKLMMEMEPHRLNSHDSVVLAPAKGSEGDQVNICDQKNENKETVCPPETKVPTLAGLAITNPSLDVLMEPRNLRENSSRVQVVSSACAMPRGNDSSGSICVDKACEEVGEVKEVDANTWAPSDFMNSEMRTTGAQTSEASVDDMDYVEFETHISSSDDKIKEEPKIKPCQQISTIKIRLVTPKPSLGKMMVPLSPIPSIPAMPQTELDMENIDDSSENKSMIGKGGIKRKDTYTVFTEEDPMEMEINMGKDENENPNFSDMDTKETSWEEMVEMTKPMSNTIITPAAIRESSVSLSKDKPFNVYPQSLLLIPDEKYPGGYCATLHIANGSCNLRAWKICMNQTANVNLVIEPQYGILSPLSEIRIYVLSRHCSTNLIGGLSQKFMEDAIMEVRSIEVFSMSNRGQFAKFWQIADARFSHLITSTKVSIQVLEPRNKEILEAIDEPERSILKKMLEEKYQNELLPQMVENRDYHLTDIELVLLEQRVEKIWRYLKHMDVLIDIGYVMIYGIAVYLGVIPYIMSAFSKDSPPDDCESSFLCRCSRTLYNFFTFN